jgi:hypothetical protein
MLGTRTKDPDDVLDYLVDFGVDEDDWLGSDTLSAVTWTVPTGITKVAQVNTTTTATIWLSGGTAGAVYTIGIRVTTAGGRTKDESLKIRIAQR